MPAKGLLLLNLGSPEAPTEKAVARYLNAFLMDPHVIDLPSVLRWPLVHGLITPRRAAHSAAAFRKIWTAQGSPLIEFTRQFAEGLANELPEWDVRWAMRYGRPVLEEVVRDWEVSELYVVPLYPQYAESSTRSAIDHLRRSRSSFKYLPDFFAAPEFIAAQAARILDHIESFRPDHVLLSFHGLPEHHMCKLHPTHCRGNDLCCAEVGPQNRHCYRAQALATARAIQARLRSESVSFSFQSRLGRRPWIKPYTDVVIEELCARGRRRVLVSCPSFVADCLETLEEIQMRLRDQFLAAGGEDLQLVPALNADPRWVKGFAQMVRRPGLEWQE